MEKQENEITELEDLDIEEEVYQMIKNKDKRFSKPKMSTLVKLVMGGLVAVSMFTSCQTATYTLEPGYGAFTTAQEIQTRTMANEVGSEAWSEAFGQSGYINADTTDSLIRQQQSTKMNIQNNKVTFVTDMQLYREHKADIDWVYEYVATVMNTVSPGMKFVKSFSENPLTDDVQREGSSIFIGMKQGVEGMAEHSQKLNFVDPVKGPIYNEVIAFNSDNQEKLNQSSAYFRTAYLKEILHSLGVTDIKKSLGGNIMSDIDKLGNYPLAVSPEEMKCLIAMYGDIKRANFYDQYLEWYKGQFEDAMNLAKEGGMPTISPANFHYDRNAGLEM